MNILTKLSKKNNDIYQNSLDILNSENPCVMNNKQRVKMTISCRDTDYIPKVSNAGKIEKCDKKEVQIMHNGIKVESGGYFGSWMSEIILNLRGHHEPQEEKLYYEVLKRLKNPGSMIELGAFWSYYSLWFKKNFPKSLVIACEPDPLNINVGKNNAELNNLNIEFVQSAAGSLDKKGVSFKPDSSDYRGTVKTIIRTVDGLMKEYEVNNLSVLHIDVQGSEMMALEGATGAIRMKSLRFVFVSTHHYSISGAPSTHLQCLRWIKKHGGYIISEHNVTESFSGDGLIVASFCEADKDFHIETSINSSNNSLFRSYEKDLESIVKAYDLLTKKVK